MRIFFRFWPYPLVAAGLLWMIAVNQLTGRWGDGRDRSPSVGLDERFYLSYLVGIAVVHAVLVFGVFRKSGSAWMPLKVSLVVLVLPVVETFLAAVLFFLHIDAKTPIRGLGGLTLDAIDAVQFHGLTQASLLARDDAHSFNSGLYVTARAANPLADGRFLTAFEIGDRKGNAALRTAIVDPKKGIIESGNAQPLPYENRFAYYPLPDGRFLLQPQVGDAALGPAALITGPNHELSTIRFPLGDGHRDGNHDFIVPMLTEQPVKLRRWIDLGLDAKYEPQLRIYESDAAAAAPTADARVTAWTWPNRDEQITQAFESGGNLYLVQLKQLLRFDLKTGHASAAFSEASKEALARNRLTLIDKVFLEGGAFFVVGTGPEASAPGNFRDVLIELDADGHEVKGFSPLDSNQLDRNPGYDKFLGNSRIRALFVRGDAIYLSSSVAPWLIKLGRDGQLDKTYLAARRADARASGGFTVLNVGSDGAALAGQWWRRSIYEKRSGLLLLIRPDGSTDPNLRIVF